MWIPVEKHGWVGKDTSAKIPPCFKNSWMSELHRPLKQVKNGYLITFQLVFLYSGQEMYLLAKGRVSPSGLHQPQLIQRSASTQKLLFQWLISRQSSATRQSSKA